MKAGKEKGVGTLCDLNSSSNILTLYLRGDLIKSFKKELFQVFHLIKGKEWRFVKSIKKPHFNIPVWDMAVEISSKHSEPISLKFGENIRSQINLVIIAS